MRSTLRAFVYLTICASLGSCVDADNAFSDVPILSCSGLPCIQARLEKRATDTSAARFFELCILRVNLCGKESAPRNQQPRADRLRGSDGPLFWCQSQERRIAGPDRQGQISGRRWRIVAPRIRKPALCSRSAASAASYLERKLREARVPELLRQTSTRTPRRFRFSRDMGGG